MTTRADMSMLVIGAGPVVTDRSAFSVQYHPEASPGPLDSFYLFERFLGGLK